MNKAEKNLVIITGASSGIGEFSARVFSAAGYPVAMLSRNIAAMESFQLPNTICIETDVTDFQNVESAITSAEKKYGYADCLINNAGVVKPGDILDTNVDDNTKMLNTNVLGVVNGIQVVLPKMRERKSGTIINLSAIADRSPRPNFPMYAATKAAIKNLTESLRVANAKFGIRFCNVAPARVDTAMLRSGGALSFDTLNVEDTAKLLLWIYEQPKNFCIRDIVFAPTTYEG